MCINTEVCFSRGGGHHYTVHFKQDILHNIKTTSTYYEFKIFYHSGSQQKMNVTYRLFI